MDKGNEQFIELKNYKWRLNIWKDVHLLKVQDKLNFTEIPVSHNSLSIKF